MTFKYPFKCKECGAVFNFTFRSLFIPDYPREDLVKRFVCGECGERNEENIAFRKEWKNYLESLR